MFPICYTLIGVQVNQDVKEQYFDTCDAMLHARSNGETFGLAVAEFSVRNKPVITQRWMRRYSDFHLSILGKKGHYFSNQRELINVVGSFVTHGVNKTRDYNAYRKFSPSRVMRKFEKIFIDPLQVKSEVETTPNINKRKERDS